MVASQSTSEGFLPPGEVVLASEWNTGVSSPRGVAREGGYDSLLWLADPLWVPPTSHTRTGEKLCVPEKSRRDSNPS